MYNSPNDRKRHYTCKQHSDQKQVIPYKQKPNLKYSITNIYSFSNIQETRSMERNNYVKILKDTRVYNR